MRKWLYNFTAKLPCRLINSGDKPYLERYMLGTLFGLRFYLHRFVGADGERWVHDHPWNALSIVLCGWYMEESLDGICLGKGWESKETKIRWLNWIPAWCFHRITQASPETWTLFIVSKKKKTWGFLTHIDKGELQDNSVMYHNPYEQQQSELWRDRLTGAEVGRKKYCEKLHEIPIEDYEGGWSKPNVKTTTK